ncbi:hypothetical protein HW555_009772 [Spodoptera exigua]|uniref:Uncharacterized protein n=1 Tax=Spodoptera exigua TaxID=7107 RepID=A0A835L0G2_SPOEX|nr:hypothetical protein HW555_009772 [Spodoptera exigua]
MVKMPVSVCLLADVCNHTWIPLCAWDNKTDDYKLFLDNCDFYEYNCDNDGNYVIRNYSDCFNPSLSTSSPCPSLDKLGTKILGYYIFKPNVQKPLIALSETTAKPTVALREKRRYTPEKTRKIKRRTTPCSPCERNKQLLAEIEAEERAMKKMIRFGAEQMVVLRKETVWKNGKMMQKVVKGFKSKPKVTKRLNTRKRDAMTNELQLQDNSDYLENIGLK